MSQEKLKLGIVGCSYIAKKAHLPAYLHLKDDIEISAVCDMNKEFAMQTANSLKTHYYLSLEDMLASEYLDIVDICTPPRTHAKLSIQAMEAGCHVLVEKPMGVNLKEADEMISISKRNSVKFCVVHNAIFDPAFIRALNLIENRSIGNLVGASVEFLQTDELLSNQNHWAHKLPGGIFSELGPHPIYILLKLLGRVTDIKVIFNKLSTFPWVIADEFSAVLQGENCSGTMFLSCLSPRLSLIVRIYGTKRTLVIDNYTMTLLSKGHREVDPISLGLDNLRNGMHMLYGTFLTSLGFLCRKYHGGHFFLIKKFVKSLRNEDKVPVTAEEGRETVSVMETISKKLMEQNEYLASA